MENKIINSLWIGNKLSKLELLTLHSFVKNGHVFHLWTYNKIKTNIPAGVVLKDANEIIPQNEIFSYQTTNWKREGSFAGFSDIFRYKLLYEVGGWWVDMDVTCLKYFNHTEPYFFNHNNVLKLIGNVMKCPKGSTLMKNSYERAKALVNQNNDNWLLPVKVLEENVLQLGLEKYISTSWSYIDDWQFLYNTHIIQQHPIPTDFYFVHWQNEMWRSERYNKNHVKFESTLGYILKLNGLMKEKHNWVEILLNNIQQSAFVNFLRRLEVIV